MKHKLYISIIFISILFLTSCKSYLHFAHKHDYVNTLIVTENTPEGRILAELIQYKTKQPILLITNIHENKILPHKKYNKDILNIESGIESINFINFLNPDKVIFLEQTQSNKLPFKSKISKNIALYNLTSDKWTTIARKAESLLGIPDLTTTFLEKINSLSK